MEYNIPITKEGYNKALINLLNAFLGMTNYEMEIVIAMLDNNIQYLNKDTRKRVSEITGKDQYTFNNYIKRLKDKQVLIKQNNQLIINPNIKNIVGETEIKINFKINPQ